MNLIHRNFVGSAFITLVVCCMISIQAQATSQCYEWAASLVNPSPQGATDSRGWFSSPKLALDDVVDVCNTNVTTKTKCRFVASCGSMAFCEFSSLPVQLQTFPTYHASMHQRAVVSGTTYEENSGVAMYSRLNPSCKVYVTRDPEPQAQCGSRCNGVGHPIDPVDGSVYDTAVDLPSGEKAIGFKRLYDSGDRSSTVLSPSWRYSFSRSIRRVQSGSTYKAFTPSSDNSPQYDSESTACTSGFAQIKSGVSTWANATASYANNVCTLSVGTTVIGTLRLYYTSQPTPAPGTTSTILYEATRDDGQVIGFSVSGSSIVAPPGINMKLQISGTGFAITDASDTVESYDANGRLLSIASRSGVVQTMGYDGAGRLSSVTDSFGHSLTLSYDGQNRLSTVARQ